MKEYISNLNKVNLEKLCLALAQVSTRLGVDGDVRFLNANEIDSDEDRKEGFYCCHSGESLLDDCES